jgi:hypothetical protein
MGTMAIITKLGLWSLRTAVSGVVLYYGANYCFNLGRKYQDHLDNGRNPGVETTRQVLNDACDLAAKINEYVENKEAAQEQKSAPAASELECRVEPESEVQPEPDKMQSLKEELMQKYNKMNNGGK